MKPTSPRAENSIRLGRVPANKEKDIGKIGAATGFEVLQATGTGAVGSSFNLVAHLHMLLDRCDGCSSGLCKASLIQH